MRHLWRWTAPMRLVFVERLVSANTDMSLVGMGIIVSTPLRCSLTIHEIYPQATSYTQSNTTPSLWKAGIISLFCVLQNRSEDRKRTDWSEEKKHAYPAKATLAANLQVHSPPHLLAPRQRRLPQCLLRQPNPCATRRQDRRRPGLRSRHLLRPRRR